MSEREGFTPGDGPGISTYGNPASPKMALDGIPTNLGIIHRSVSGLFGGEYHEWYWRCPCGWTIHTNHEHVLNTSRFHVAVCPKAHREAPHE